MKVYKKIICDMFWLNQEIFSNCNFDVKDYTIIHSLFLFRTFKMVVRDSEFPELRIVSLTLCRITRKFVSTIPNLLGKLLWFWYSMYWHVNCCLIQIEILLRDKVDKANVRTGLSHCAALRQFKTNMIPALISSSFVINDIVFDTICHRCRRFLKHNFYFSSISCELPKFLFLVKQRHSWLGTRRRTKKGQIGLYQTFEVSNAYREF